MTTREQLRDLVDHLPEEKLPAALTYLQDLAAGEEEEPLTPEDIAAIEEGKKALAEGRLIPHEEAMRELGLR